MASSWSFSSSSGGATAVSSVLDATEEKTNGTKLARLLIDGGSDVLRRFLSSIYSPETLQNVLKKDRSRLQHLKSKGVIFHDQWEKLFPSTGAPAEIEKFDITLLHLVIRECSHLPQPATGWHKMPAEDDESIQAHITRIKCFRNDLCHNFSTGIPNSEFEDKWNKLSSCLEKIEVEVRRKVYRQKIDGLKNRSIDDKICQEVVNHVKQWQHLEKREGEDNISEPFSYLPDKLPERFMFGRSLELNKIKECIETKNVPLVLITGGPGFGKTTVANSVAYELAKPENKRTVLFCSLRSKKTFSDVAVEMIYSCGNAHLPENPDQWLKEWSKHIQTRFTFVLDNADDVLASDEREKFLNTLSDVRKLSGKKGTFVITSRTEVHYPELLPEVVPLERLSPEEATELLISRVTEKEIRDKLCETDKIVELCGCAPLALSIVGSLLSDFSEEKLIKHLKENPIDLLEDGTDSFQAAIQTSFDLLKRVELDALVVLSVFPGTFDGDAAEDVMAVACSGPHAGTLPLSILRSLKKSSLIEEPRSRRYQLHPLICHFAKKIGKKKSETHLLKEGERLACAHFMSRLDENSKTYWSKDACSASIKSFHEERHNFEHFLEVYTKGMETHEKRITENCQDVFDDFLRTCLYLEMCLSPWFYRQFLERMLKSFTEPVELDPVRVVELLCLVWNEKRKVDQNEEHSEYIEGARKWYSDNSSAFASNAESEVFYTNCYSDFLSKKRDYRLNGQIRELSERALEVCDKKLEVNHPEKGEALLRAGRFARLMRKRPLAEQRLQEALKLFQQRLGKHVRTVYAYKDNGDFFFSCETSDKLKEAVQYYQKGEEMAYEIGTENSKEIINLLKNRGRCERRRKNCTLAKQYLERALVVAERELKTDHMWKVDIKTSLAFVLEEIGDLENAKQLMKEALKMHYGLKGKLQITPGYDLSNFLQRYKDDFPESEFPRILRTKVNMSEA